MRWHQSAKGRFQRIVSETLLSKTAKTFSLFYLYGWNRSTDSSVDTISLRLSPRKVAKPGIPGSFSSRPGDTCAAPFEVARLGGR
jgi:hypothetical protein